jgi:Transposase DDE domain
VAGLATNGEQAKPICFSPHLYRARNLVERFFNNVKQFRRVATRYDKLAANYLAFVQLASIRLWLRANESAPWPASHTRRSRNAPCTCGKSMALP